MATHSYDGTATDRCIEHEHVDADYGCTHLRVTDANDVNERWLAADDLREMALALAEHAAKLHRQYMAEHRRDRPAASLARRLDITRRMADDLGLTDFAGIRCFTPDERG